MWCRYIEYIYIYIYIYIYTYIQYLTKRSWKPLKDPSRKLVSSIHSFIKIKWKWCNPAKKLQLAVFAFLIILSVIVMKKTENMKKTKYRKLQDRRKDYVHLHSIILLLTNHLQSCHVLIFCIQCIFPIAPPHLWMAVSHLFLDMILHRTCC